MIILGLSDVAVITLHKAVHKTNPAVNNKVELLSLPRLVDIAVNGVRNMWDSKWATMMNELVSPFRIS